MMKMTTAVTEKGKKMSNFRIKWQWFRRCNNSLWYKILVLLGITKSPTLELNLKHDLIQAYAEMELARIENIIRCFDKCIKEVKDDEE